MQFQVNDHVKVRPEYARQQDEDVVYRVVKAPTARALPAPN